MKIKFSEKKDVIVLLNFIIKILEKNNIYLNLVDKIYDEKFKFSGHYTKINLQKYKYAIQFNSIDQLHIIIQSKTQNYTYYFDILK